MDRVRVVAVGAMLCCLLAGYWSGYRSKGAVVELAKEPAPLSTPPLRVTGLQQLGHDLMECKIRVLRVMCMGSEEACRKAMEGSRTETIFDVIRDRTEENEFDVVALVDEEMAKCKAMLGEEYRRKVMMSGDR